MTKSNDDKQLKKNIAAIIQEALDVLPRDKFATDASVFVPMPKTEAVNIKDSVEVMERHVS